MKKILNLIKCEFIKNYTVRNILIVFIVLLISVIGVTELTYMTTKQDLHNLTSEINYYKEEYKAILQEKNSLERDFKLNHVERMIEIYEMLEKFDNEIYQPSWQLDLGREIVFLEDRVFVINQMLENPEEEFSTDSVTKTGYAVIETGTYEGTIYQVKEEKTRTLEEQKKDLQEIIGKYRNLLESNQYYQFIEYLIMEYEQNSNKNLYRNDIVFSNFRIDYENIKFYKMIISKKIENENDKRALKIFQVENINGEFTISTESEYRQAEYDSFKWSYSGYVRRINEENNLKKEMKSIIEYSIEHDLDHDLEVNKKVGLDYGFISMSSKLAVNQVLHLSVIVMLLVTLTSAGIISKEHSKGSVKLLLTSPISRGKVFASKFIYLILHTYILWFVALFLIFIYAGIRFGFVDLFNPKLVYYGSKVHEVNYLFWIIKEIMINSIPVLAMVSILFMLSTITLNTSLAVVVSTLLAILSPAMWFIISKLKLVFLVYTPLPYFDIAIMKNKSEGYLNTLALIPVNQLIAYIICFGTIIICYCISHKIYIKRDVTNGGD